MLVATEALARVVPGLRDSRAEQLHLTVMVYLTDGVGSLREFAGPLCCVGVIVPPGELAGLGGVRAVAGGEAGEIEAQHSRVRQEVNNLGVNSRSANHLKFECSWPTCFRVQTVESAICFFSSRLALEWSRLSMMVALSCVYCTSARVIPCRHQSPSPADLFTNRDGWVVNHVLGDGVGAELGSRLQELAEGLEEQPAEQGETDSQPQAPHCYQHQAVTLANLDTPQQPVK